MAFETIIGLEVHAQLLTKSKMFCRCSADYASTPPNTHVCQVCLGMPGVLPMINRRAVEYTIMTALALNCSIAEYTRFDRKNYPYPDLMKGYQISQYNAPIGYQGHLDIKVNGREKRVGITRVHLEEDVAKLVHQTSVKGESYSLVDVNRSGVPLMEVVSEPDLRSAEEARQYLVQLRSILRYLQVSTGNMEEGSFRCDANISVHLSGKSDSQAKVEVKNMNSFKAVYLALEYEEKRQQKLIGEGKRLVQETRGWVEEKGRTVAQRSKEYAHDYRYFPEPDLPPLVLGSEWIEEIRKKIPELPDDRRRKFITKYDLSANVASSLTSSKEMADNFEYLVEEYGLPPKDTSNTLLGKVSAIMNANNIDVAEFFKKVNHERFVRLAKLRQDGTVNTATYKSMLEEMFETGKDPDTILKEGERGQISDAGEIQAAVKQVIETNPKAVTDYKEGREQSLKFLVGQVMRLTKGRANPELVNEELKKKLKE